MPMAFQCPFWRRAQGGVSVCEGCTVTFVAKEEKAEFFWRYCGDAEGWRDCTIAKMLTQSYERGLRE